MYFQTKNEQQLTCRLRSAADCLGAPRRGVTVLEVLFATGIAVSGMLGIASLLLMAGRNASQANRASESQALSQDWYNEFLTRGVNRPENWVWYQDYPFTVGGSTVSPQLRNLSKSFFAAPDARLTKSVGSTGMAQMRPSGKISVCIDPAFFSNSTIRASLSAFNQTLAGAHWYRPAVFPYYQDGFNPLTDSDYSVNASSGMAWNDQPRMLRATLGTPSFTMNEKQVQSLFATQDDLSTFVSQQDSTLPAVRVFQTMPDASGQTPIIAAGSSKTQYSWMATLSPLDQSDTSLEDYYTLSLIVMHQRDRLFIDPSLFASRSASVPSPETKPQGERLTWVYPLSGNFFGGSGGRVRIFASEATESTIVIGDWIMLSKHVSGSVVATNTVQPFSVFRWYRVVGVDPEPTVGNLATMGPDPSSNVPFTDPYGNNPGGPPSDAVWSRDVVLAGPDWDFSATIFVAPGVPLITPTTGTLVNGAVSVYERVITVPE